MECRASDSLAHSQNRTARPRIRIRLPLAICHDLTSPSLSAQPRGPSSRGPFRGMNTVSRSITWLQLGAESSVATKYAFRYAICFTVSVGSSLHSSNSLG